MENSAQRNRAGTKRDFALIYIRESSHRLGDPDESPERQLARCKRLCESHGWRYEVFQEPPGHRSGKYEAGRPKWKELKERLKQPDVVAIIVSRLDRASRSLEDFSNFLKMLSGYGVEFVSVKENFDTSSAMGKAFLRVMLILLELESDVASERIREMVLFKKEKGLTWGTIPYGYDRKSNVLSVSEDGVKKGGRLLKDTEAIRLVLEGYAKGDFSYHGGALKLNALGYRMRDRLGRRHLFTHKNIRVFVENAMLYAGYVPDKNGWKKGPHQALISRELAERIEQARIRRKALAAGRSPARTYALTPILFCGNCGSKLLGCGPINGKYYYRHSAGGKQPLVCQKGWTQVEMTEVEGHVREVVRGLQIPEAAMPIVRSLAKARAEMANGSQGKKIAETLRRLEGQLVRAKRLYVAGDFTEEEYEAEKQGLEKLIEEENRKLGPPPYDVEALVEKIRTAGAIIAETSDPSHFKRAVGMLFERLETVRKKDGTWKLSKVVPKQEFRDFF